MKISIKTLRSCADISVSYFRNSRRNSIPNSQPVAFTVTRFEFLFLISLLFKSVTRRLYFMTRLRDAKSVMCLSIKECAYACIYLCVYVCLSLFSVTFSKVVDIVDVNQNDRYWLFLQKSNSFNLVNITKNLLYICFKCEKKNCIILTLRFLRTNINLLYAASKWLKGYCHIYDTCSIGRLKACRQKIWNVITAHSYS